MVFLARAIALLIAFLLPPTSGIAQHLPGASEPLTIAVIGKTKHDSFYEQSFAGCEAFANSKSDVKCLYDGPELFQDIREQVIATKAMIERGVDGIIVSTTDSKYLTQNALVLARKKGIPVITFDSDLLPEHQEYRLAYVGTNNFEFGVALGEYAERFKREGNTQICIQSGHTSTPNLNERIRGVRFALSGKADNSRLAGENGWVEYYRCPFYTLGKREMALRQLELLLNKQVPVYIAVAGFAQFSPDYIKRISPYKPQINSQSTVIISADTEQVQLDALNAGLSTVNIGQRPFEMGRLSTQMLYEYIKENKLPEQQLNYLDFHYCTRQNAQSCISHD
ncbi:substrate-binding domain-containing protein [uncultured Shewanella sp.]|uniref:substrate-binding domain-containing protein n=1 Tax=uncultured Shewanella sp. TaxID=173975 RepID=UPI002621E9BA|nr:substrate-binding domain-containing protein [uncultured Shewanella sp.]